jgi:transcriptional regulator with XRE-family HTH domain
MTTLGERLKLLRKGINKTQDQIAEIIGVSRSSYSLYEIDINIPPDDIKIKLAKLYSVSLDYICGLSDFMTNIEIFKLDNNEFVKIPLLKFPITSKEPDQYIYVSKEKALHGKYYYAYSPMNMESLRIKTNDLLFVKEQRSFENGINILGLLNNKPLVGQLFDSFENYLIVNNSYKNGFISIKKSELNIIGIIVEVNFSLR